MKIGKYILYGIGALLLIIISLGLFGPKTYHVERSVNIKAEIATVYGEINNFASLNAWSPWNKYDTAVKRTIEGTDGTVGAKACWEGNDQVGSGCQSFTKMENNRVDILLEFKKPWEATAKTSLTAMAGEGSCKVTWAIDGDNNFMSRVICTFMSMDKMMGKDFEEGLNNLKMRCESMPKKYRGYEIKEMQVDAKNYIGVRKTMSFKDDMSAFFGASYGMLMASKPEMMGAPVGLFFSWDEKTQMTDMAAAIPVKEAKDGKGYKAFAVPASKALVIEYYGAYDKSAEAHGAMDDYMKEKGLTQKAPVVEEYITSPMSEKDTAKWLTKIYYLVD